MRVSAREVCAHPTVLALDELTRTVLLALIREADQWGELDPATASRVADCAARNQDAARQALRTLHTVRLCHRDKIANRIVVWTPRQREDADVFAMTPGELSSLETEVNGPIPELTANESEAL